MTEKNYNPEQKHMKAGKAMEKAGKGIGNEQKAPAQKTEAKKEESEGKTGEAAQKKETAQKKIKKPEAIVRGAGVPVSSKESFAICRFIKNKEISRAVSELEEILQHKKALPMKGEIPHRRGKGMMSGRYPKNSIKAFIMLLKSLNANAAANDMSNPVITTAYANFATRPYGKSGMIRKKRTNVTIIAKERKEAINKKA
jgi:ribosomal protein L22